jgi:hypothetical protein
MQCRSGWGPQPPSSGAGERSGLVGRPSVGATLSQECVDNALISLLARADSPKVHLVRREGPLRSLPGLALSRAIAPHLLFPRPQALRYAAARRGDT